jgi:hypothetical protein
MPCNGEVLGHTAYIPDLLLCDFHILEPLKKVLKGHTFTLDDTVQEAVVKWLRQQPKEFFADGIYRLVHQWDSSLNACGDFLTVAIPSPVSILEQVSFEHALYYAKITR